VRLRTWPILLAGFGMMVLLTIVFALENERRAYDIHAKVLALHESHRRSEDLLRDIEGGIYLSGLFVRDFLLDPSHLAADEYRRELIELRSAMESDVAALGKIQDFGDRRPLDELGREIGSYWDSLDPVFEWTPQQKAALSSLFLRKQVLPRREAALNVARSVKTLASADLKQHQDRLAENMASFRATGRWRMAVVVLLAAGIAAVSVIRISRLERRSEQQRLSTENAENELRRLSQRLVSVQEEESRRLSRELHDEVGQMLTALRVELGNLDKLRDGPEPEFHAHLDDAKNLAVRTLSSVRNLASGLRPSVLDDFGLGPALQWQAREFSRRTGVPVEVVLGETPVKLPDRHRTCVYRVVQEALTNCSRHAHAREIRVALHIGVDQLSLTIQDDGRGMPVDPPEIDRVSAGGLGLVGMEERVRELGGSFEIYSQPGKGTLIKVSIPVPAEEVA
jgi:signal transduction histidine kinase